ncbi:MAG: UDP-N-acetylmuramoyl-L-alanine--D-glutamate ligase [Gammaproteobacteria bacterium]|nr:UDP-N-acetylmuramoyl-L-alanine--D-glutamate ligase [Gammaproteobacteria bacterium]
MRTSDLHVVVGLGATGLSCVRFLRERGFNVAITDTRDAPPHLSALLDLYPDIALSLGGLSETLLNRADRIILSPGIPLTHPVIANQLARGKSVIGDIELFAQFVRVPVVAITGTNAKSTVTTLIGKMGQAAGLHTLMGGNLGVPALDLLSDEKAELIVLELSSFQLETTASLRPKVATILNITPDHMDRYADFSAYQSAKQKVYRHCDVAVCNGDDPLTDVQTVENKFYFTLNKPLAKQFGIIRKQDDFLAFENQPLLNVNELPILGQHYYANALAALAIGHGVGLPFETMLKVLQEFQGLPHRCQLVRERAQVKWYNDSKGTNVGATQAAILGLGATIPGKLILIAGGLGKNADFSPLIPVMEKYIRHVILIGEAAPDLANVIANKVPYTFASDMADAIEKAQASAHALDCVLLSPACASYDMFKNFEHRGEVFTKLVMDLSK